MKLYNLNALAALQRAACSGITQGAEYNCENPIAPGVNQRLIIGNLDDIDVITYNVTNTYIIEDITMKSAAPTFAFEGVRRSLNPQYSLVPQTVSIGYDHVVDFSVFDISAEQKENLEAMAVKPQFCIVQNLNDAGNGDNYFEVYGVTRGLDVLANVRIPGDGDTAGAFVLQLSTPADGGKENKMPSTWFITDFATTLDAVNATLSPLP
jgi:hypothetical protein